MYLVDTAIHIDILESDLRHRINVEFHSIPILQTFFVLYVYITFFLKYIALRRRDCFVDKSVTETRVHHWSRKVAFKYVPTIKR